MIGKVKQLGAAPIEALSLMFVSKDDMEGGSSMPHGIGTDGPKLSQVAEHATGRSTREGHQS